MSTKVTDQSRSAISAQVVTTTATFANDTRAIYVGTPGDLAVRFADGVSVTLKSASGYNPVQVVGIDGEATTADNIVALF